MPRKKERDWVRVNFSLEPRLNEKLKESAKFEGMNNSEFVEFLIHQWDAGINPEIKLNELLSKRELIQNQLNRIDIEIKEISDQLVLFNQWKNQRKGKKAEAIKILEGALMKNNPEEAQRIGKFLQKTTGVPAFQLLVEAKQNIDKKGI